MNPEDDIEIISNDEENPNNNGASKETNDMLNQVRMEIELKVISMDEKIFIIKVNINDKVSDLKAKIEQVSEVPIDRQRLIHKGKQLDNEKQLKSYNMSHMDAIHFIAKLQVDNEPRNSTVDQPPRLTRDILDINNPLPFGFLSFPPLRRRRIREVTTNTDVVDNMHSIVQNNTVIEDFINCENINENFSSERLKKIINLDYKIDLIDFEKRTFTIGQWIDVKDTVHQWLEAEVIEIEDYSEDNSQRKIKVHYIGWDENWDEWLPFNSRRVMPFRYFTVEKFKDRFCPSIKTISSTNSEKMFEQLMKNRIISDQLRKNNRIQTNMSNSKNTSNYLSLNKNKNDNIDNTDKQLSNNIELNLTSILSSMGKILINII